MCRVCVCVCSMLECVCVCVCVCGVLLGFKSEKPKVVKLRKFASKKNRFMFKLGIKKDGQLDCDQIPVRA